MQNQLSTSSSDTHNRQLARSQSEVDAMAFALAETGMDPANPDFQKLCEETISVFRSLGLDHYKPGEELNSWDLTAFVLAILFPTEPFEEISTGPLGFNPTYKPQSKEMENLDLQLIMLELESDPRFAKVLEVMYQCTNKDGYHRFISRRIAFTPSGRQYYKYLLTFTELAEARSLHAKWVYVNTMMP